MPFSIFQTPRSSSPSDQPAEASPLVLSDRLGERVRGRLRLRADRPGSETTAEPFIDPVHGRHCICTRCDLQRAA
jgi:hypothetical protein